MRRIALLTGAIVFFDTLFYTALTPLLPHYSHAFGLGKTGAGILAGAYPAGTFFGAVPSGIAASRLGAKRTVLVGLTCVAACTLLFGIGNRAWELDLARFVQGLASSFSWTGALTWLIAGMPPGRRGTVIGAAFASATAGALFGPVLGAVASVAGTGWTFGIVSGASLGLAGWALATAAPTLRRAQPLSMLVRALRDPRVLVGGWFVLLPALLFGCLSVLAPLRLSTLGFGAVAIGAAFLVAAAGETVNNVVIGRASDRHGPLAPLRIGLVASTVVAALLPWPARGWELGVLVVLAGISFGTFFTPGMTMLSHAGELRGLEHGYTFSLVNLAWAPGQSAGSGGGGALASATSDKAVYLLLAGICFLSLVGVWRSRTSTASTTPSAEASSG